MSARGTAVCYYWLIATAYTKALEPRPGVRTSESVFLRDVNQLLYHQWARIERLDWCTVLKPSLIFGHRDSEDWVENELVLKDHPDFASSTRSSYRAAT